MSRKLTILYIAALLVITLSAIGYSQIDATYLPIIGASDAVFVAEAEVVTVIAAGARLSVVCQGSNMVYITTDAVSGLLVCAPSFPTIVVPTATPPLASTPAPTAVTPTATPASNATPFAAAPLCQTHDPAKWHALWDAARGCHYTHVHGWNPALANDIFGPISATAQSEISYPWLTPNEQATKHSGYRYGINKNIPCEFDFLEYLPQSTNCVRAFRIQYHNHAMLDPTIRYHSFAAEGQLCNRAGTLCGTMRTGGWVDTGILEAPYKVNHVPLAGDPPGVVDLQAAPYKAFNALSWGGVDFLARYNVASRSCKGCPADRNAVNDNVSYWSTDKPYGPRFGYDLLFGYDTWQYDTSILIETGVVSTPLPVAICPLGNCRFNGSEELFYTVSFRVPPELDTDKNGIVENYSGYTDVKGNIVSTCTSPGANCVPLIIKNAPVGNAVWSRQDNLGYTIKQPDGTLGPPEWDVSPGNEWWINIHEH